MEEEGEEGEEPRKKKKKSGVGEFNSKLIPVYQCYCPWSSSYTVSVIDTGCAFLSFSLPSLFHLFSLVLSFASVSDVLLGETSFEN